MVRLVILFLKKQSFSRVSNQTDCSSNTRGHLNFYKIIIKYRTKILLFDKHIKLGVTVIVGVFPTTSYCLPMFHVSTKV